MVLQIEENIALFVHILFQDFVASELLPSSLNSCTSPFYIMMHVCFTGNLWLFQFNENMIMEPTFAHCSFISLSISDLINSQTLNMSRAEELVKQMEEEGIDAPIDIYHTMMDGYMMVGDEAKCLIVFERLRVYIFLLTI